ncbi:Rieske 2Fe-2S domain-containing protein [Azospirillum sp. ST 5-10]|uniref:Rieske 2Fe-2S domain-containing protein n=1 Tax=unclassified Azospirillum TaxID=2630922 RepID=UPI003F4A82F5
MSLLRPVKNTWYAAGFSEEFPARKLTGHTIVNQPVVIWRTEDGAVVAFDNRCAHKRFPLSEGRLLDDGTIECAYHGLCFDTAGRCVAIPSHPDGPIPPQARMRPVPVVEQDGIVWVWSGDPAKAGTVKPPRTPELVDPEWESIGSEPMDVPANYLLLIENLLDITHFYPLHDGNIGDVANSRIPIQLEEGEVDGNRYVKTTRRVSGYRQPPFLMEWFHYEEVDRVHTHHLVSPGLTRVEMRVAPPGRLGQGIDRGYVLYHTHTPVDDANHVWRWRANCRADHTSRSDPTVSAAKRVAEMFPSVVAQDRWALERQQRMFAYADNGYSELFLKPDLALRRARQIIATMLREEEEPAPAAVGTVAAE